MTNVLRRLRSQAGFGMVELAVAMALLAIGLMAVFGLLVSSMTTVRRAATETTAAALADAELEGFRAVTYDAIVLSAADVAAAPAPYAADPAYGAPGAGAGAAVTCATAGCTANEPSRTVTGADGLPYRVDTYVTWQATESQTAPTPTAGRNVKLVTVVVRSVAAPDTVYARVATSFDEATGLAG